MRVATIVRVVVSVVLSMVAVLSLVDPMPDTAVAREPAQPARLLVALDERDGSVVWRAKPDGRVSGFLTVRAVSHGVVIADELRCLSGERQYEAGDASVVAFDVRTGTERWHVSDAQ